MPIPISLAHTPTPLPILTSFLAPHQWYIDGFHLFDFFTDDLWSAVDPAWRAFVDAEAADKGADAWINVLVGVACGADVPSGWPSGLADVVKGAREVAFGREAEGDDVEDEEACRLAAMSRKKLHEVERMARVVRDVTRRHNVDAIIDVGAGTGYLTHTLAAQNPQLQLYALDSDVTRTHGSLTRGARILPSIHHQKKPAKPTSSSSPQLHHPPIKHITAYLTPTTLAEHCQNRENSLVLVGLHACGDLGGRTLLDTFAHCPAVKALVVSCCCYQRIALSNDPSDTHVGFPLSTALRDILAASTLKITHRGLAAASLTFASFKDRATIKHALRGHYHRALLQFLLAQIHPPPPTSTTTTTTTTTRVGSVPHTATTSFPLYAAAALHKLNIPLTPHIETLIATLATTTTTALARIAFLCTLRSTLGPALESLVIADRANRARECVDACGGGEVRVSNVFEYTKSPRNTVLVAEKGSELSF
ncbi:hypothetical protein PhCBS80983_g05735 [Powellomyces hirtus]|uniref:Methyltransferase domain-containing protein n=1 Tax=Powellomyces hirtus TaxID=109895 RepID=A0A507DU84_9FUNG|nr:hypothetical protein PhCBS80983_g05735 [Powellomyces hirtus]